MESEEENGGHGQFRRDNEGKPGGDGDVSGESRTGEARGGDRGRQHEKGSTCQASALRARHVSLNFLPQAEENH